MAATRTTSGCSEAGHGADSAGPAGASGVGVGHAQRGQQRGLARFHAPGFGGTLVIPALGMQGAVHQQVGVVVLQRPVGGVGLGLQHRGAQHQIGHHDGRVLVVEGEHVGGVVLATEIAVQCAALVRIDDARTLTFPDYTGNAYFNTLGNISRNPRAGLLFIDFSNGDLLFLTGSSSWAVFSLLLRLHPMPPLAATVATTLGSAVVYLPVWWLFLPSTMDQAPMAEIAMQAVYQGVLVVFVAMILYTFAVRQLGPQTVALLMAFVPGLSALAAVPLLGEPLSLLTLAGLGAVTLGAVLGARVAR